MHIWQAEVEDEKIKLGIGHQGSVGLVAACHMVHSGTRTAQGAQQAVGQHLIVLGNEYAHACLLQL